ncbi:hypothetical protein JCM19237_1435 [Photobacterium aphoticum]|uniref:Uncharacterized protein n=1 Tax=Photobacterium aphoticum TaxID=754436 RepID=A0A090QWG8_9GAMM|nr:hypothetical protein JCM19237_1435 [Photobacterium aphoticum]
MGHSRYLLFSFHFSRCDSALPAITAITSQWVFVMATPFLMQGS